VGDLTLDLRDIVSNTSSLNHVIVQYFNLTTVLRIRSRQQRNLGTLAMSRQLCKFGGI
jgi:hypothetical protein